MDLPAPVRTNRRFSGPVRYPPQLRHRVQYLSEYNFESVVCPGGSSMLGALVQILAVLTNQVSPGLFIHLRLRMNQADFERI